jgi:hypothetical protein
LWLIPLYFLCNAVLVDTNCFSLSLPWKVLIHEYCRKALLDTVFLVKSFSLSEFQLYCSMLSWLSEFVLRCLR